MNLLDSSLERFLHLLAFILLSDCVHVIQQKECIQRQPDQVEIVVYLCINKLHEVFQAARGQQVSLLKISQLPQKVGSLDS